MNIMKLFILSVPFVLTLIMRLVLFLGSIRMKFRISSSLEDDLVYIVPYTSHNLNMFWDLESGKYPAQPHHKQIDIFDCAIRGTFKTLWVLTLSIMPWEFFSKK